MAQLLIVDNDARIVELTAWFLQRFGHEVETALSYAAARELLRERRPELMLADLDLGAESGREELPRLFAEGLLPPTLVVSGFLDAELERELTALPGVHGTLAKPVDLDALQARILDCLATAAKAQEIAGSPATSASAPLDETPAEPEDDDGWVEIVPLRADVLPAPAVRGNAPTIEPVHSEPDWPEPAGAPRPAPRAEDAGL